MATTTRDYYDILGVNKKANDKEIRAAYRKLARKHHPDLNPGDKSAEARFKELQEAYEVLSDSEKRAKYDRFGHGWENIGQAPFGREYSSGQYQTGGPSFDFGDIGVDTEEMDIGDILGRVFGGFGRTGTQTRPRRGRDLEQPVAITLEEAYQGTARVIEIATPGGQPRRLEVKIPAGVRDGSKVRVTGEGSPGVSGGQRGDLYLLITLRPHSMFERKGDDVHVEVNVPLTVALLGGEVKVPTLKGTKVALKVPADSQNGRAIRLAGMGMPKPGDAGFGDMFARLKVVLPTKLSKEERELIEELRRLRPEA